MDNVPSTAIILVIAIILACIIGAFVFLTVNTQKENGLSANTSISNNANKINESIYTQFDGEEVLGTVVTSVANQYKDNPHNVQVLVNGEEAVDYIPKIVKSATYTGKITKDNTGKIVKLEFNEIKKGENDKENNTEDNKGDKDDKEEVDNKTTYRVTWNSGEYGTLNGNSEQIITFINGKTQDILNIPNITANTGYGFTKWNRPIPNINDIKGNIDFVAQYDKINYTVTLINLSKDINSKDNITSREGTYKGKYTFLLKPKDKHYYITDGKNGNEDSITIDGTFIEENQEIDCTKYKVVPKKYYFDLNGIIDGNRVKDIKNYGIADIYINNKLESQGQKNYWKEHNYGTSYKIEVKAKEGYKIEGEHTFEGRICENDSCWTKENNNFEYINVCPKINRKEYTITWNADGGTIDGKKEVTTKGKYKDKVTKPNNPVRKGYKFTGWKDAPSIYTKNMTVYANWKEEIYNIEYNLNGGKNHKGNPSIYTINSDTITLKNPTRTGYEFIGWSNESQDKPIIRVVISHNSLGNREFTAHWRICASDNRRVRRDFIKHTSFVATYDEGNVINYDKATAYREDMEKNLKTIVCEKHKYINDSDPGFLQEWIHIGVTEDDKVYGRYEDRKYIMISPDGTFKITYETEYGDIEAAYVENLPHLQDISGLKNWDISGTTTLHNMFSGCTQLSDLSPIKDWDISHITDMHDIFSGCENINLSSLSNWNVENVTDMSDMFSCCSLTDISPIKDWDVGNVTNMEGMFNNCFSCYSLTDISPLKDWDVSNVKNMERMFWGCKNLEDISALKDWDVSNVTNMKEMFEHCFALSDISGLAKWNVGNVTNMSSMFKACSSKNTAVGYGQTGIKDLTPLKDWDVSNVENMQDMFYDCNRLESVLPLKDWDVKNVKNMVCIFRGCSDIPRLEQHQHDQWVQDIRNISDWNKYFFGTE